MQNKYCVYLRAKTTKVTIFSSKIIYFDLFFKVNISTKLFVDNIRLTINFCNYGGKFLNK